MRLRSENAGPISGTIRVPGDKSLSHRSLILGGLATGTTRIRGLLQGEDVTATRRAIEALGVAIEAGDNDELLVSGCGTGGWREPETVLDLGNAGTGSRLLMGALAGQPFRTFLTGDASLRHRPMNRVIAPLTRMGAAIEARTGGFLPMTVTGRLDLLPITHESAVASAQVKSAVLLAGLHARGRTTVIEPSPSRDHTENMLARMGAPVTRETLADGRHAVSVAGHVDLTPLDIQIPGDPSSAAFPIAAALLSMGSDLRIENLLVNPLRTGLICTLKEMGADIELTNEHDSGGEQVADLRVRSSRLRGVHVPPERAPSMIDEFPILSVIAAHAEGRTVMDGVRELRVKESDRIACMEQGLKALGVAVTSNEDQMIVEGIGNRPLEGGVTLDAALDHRIAMSFLVMGGASTAGIEVNGAETIATSFPNFASIMTEIGLPTREIG
ncbi:MAG: 3-phosphoshikimate 1-carboxyvinyltransferase [Geminicoccaceae bacterium]